MNDGSKEDPDDGLQPEAESGASMGPQPPDHKLSFALALVGLLVFLIIFVNIPGIRSSAGISMQANWTLESYADSAGTLVPVHNGTHVSAVFGSDGKVSGSAGCNRYYADYTVRDFAISISPPVSTEIFCMDMRVMQQESDYLTDLPGVAELRISETYLKLYDTSGKPVLVFVKRE
jgi:heat shock protein HslJ